MQKLYILDPMNPFNVLSRLVLVVLLLPCIASGQAWKTCDSIAQVKLKKGDLKGALDAFNKAIDTDNNNSFLYNQRADVKVKLKDYNGSIDDYTKAINIFHGTGSYYLRGMSWYMLKNYKEALADFDTTISMELALTYEVYFLRGNIKFKLLDYKGSIADYTTSIEMKPGYAKAYYNRGVSKYYGDQKTEACKDVDKAKELGFTDIDPLVKKYCDYYNSH